MRMGATKRVADLMRHELARRGTNFLYASVPNAFAGLGVISDAVCRTPTVM